MIPQLDNPQLQTYIKSQLPTNIVGDYPVYVQFLEAYYEWLSQEDNLGSMVFNIEKIQNVDYTPTKFLEYFKSQYIHLIPGGAAADPRHMIKLSKDFYETKGTEKSYEILFRAIFNTPVEFYYPSKDILIASDGKWTRDNSIFVYTENGVDLFNQEGYAFTSQTSKVTVFVNLIRRIQIGRYDVWELLVSAAPATDLIIGETLISNSSPSKQCKVYGILKTVEIIEQGHGYYIGDVIEVLDLTGNGVDGQIVVTNVNSDNTIASVDVLEAGEGYRVGDPVILTPVDGGFGATAVVATISDPTLRYTCVTLLRDIQNWVLNDYKAITLRNLSVFENIALGGIETVTVIEDGEGYKELPSVSVGQKQPTYGIPAGHGSILRAVSSTSGGISGAKVLNPGCGYIQHPTYPLANTAAVGDGDAVLDLTVYGGVRTGDGYWIGDYGKLNSSKRLQDDYYYQKYSYVLKSELAISKYKAIVNGGVHPSGLKMFGEVLITDEIPLIDYQDNSRYEITILDTIDNNFEFYSYFNSYVYIFDYISGATIYGRELTIGDYTDDYINSRIDEVLGEFDGVEQDTLLDSIYSTTLSYIYPNPISDFIGHALVEDLIAQDPEIVIVDTGLH